MTRQNKPQQIFISPRQVFFDLFLILTGSVLCALGINGILIPQHFVMGGITGISIIIHDQMPFINTGWIYLAINIPLFALAWMAVGRRFFAYSIVGALSLTLAMAFIKYPIHVNDKMLSALLAGILVGAGAGAALRSSGSQGGLDILAVMLLKRFSISLGNTILMVNTIILLLVLYVYSLEAVLYTLVVIFVSSKVVALVVTGLSQRKAVFIISPKSKQISEEILKDIRRGVTLLHGEGGFSSAKEQIIYTVITFGEISHLKRIIQQIDPDAFVVISNTLEVLNYRIGNQPHW
jgi:uncharacterized membrane-anchored protein YitT (DUF2179 family)